MRSVAMAILILLPCAGPLQGAVHPAKCDRFADLRQAEAASARGPAVQRLDRLPPADVHLTVERRIDGCRQPTIVAQGIGGPAFRGR
jgi:hypothetical protein